MTLSICIPSYNRGSRALSLVSNLLEITSPYSDEVEIVVSDNGSNNEKDEYAAIEAIEDKRVRFHRFDQNRFYVGNFNQVLKMSSGDWCLLISDEDSLSEEGLEYYMNSLPQIKEIGIVRASTSFSYADNREGFYDAGFQAIDEYYFSGNYISGIIYNRAFVTDELLSKLWDMYYEKDKQGYFYYPHMFLDAEILSRHPLWRDSTLLVIEGKDAEDVPVVEGTKMHVYATYDARLEQMKGFFIQLNDMNPSEEISLKMIMRLLGKTAAYIGAKKDTYDKMGVDWNRIREESIMCMQECVTSLDNDAVRKYNLQITEYINSLAKIYF